NPPQLAVIAGRRAFAGPAPPPRRPLAALPARVRDASPEFINQTRGLYSAKLGTSSCVRRAPGIWQDSTKHAGHTPLWRTGRRTLTAGLRFPTVPLYEP